VLITVPLLRAQLQDSQQVLHSLLAHPQCPLVSGKQLQQFHSERLALWKVKKKHRWVKFQEF